MITVFSMMVFISVFSFILGVSPIEWESRPRLQGFTGFEVGALKRKRSILSFIRKLALINKPFTMGPVRVRMLKDLEIAHVNMTPEEYFLVKELVFVFFIILTFNMVSPQMFIIWLACCFGIAYMAPEFWLKGKIKKIKSAIIKELPDAIDLLRLCVNAGLDFMLAMKWVVEKSPPSVIIREFNTVMQEINLGKARRDAIKDLAVKYDLPDLSTLARTLIQADKMGTSVAEALNILSEDMRLARFRRGEQLAMKAPLKMLVPLLFFIFPVVGILVAGPIFLDFVENNPLAQLTKQ